MKDRNPTLTSPRRRSILKFAGVSASAPLIGGLGSLGVLAGCGGHDDSGTPATAADPIWGPSGSATQIVNAL